ncbi:MAG: hypothetical protein AAB368_06280, partial [bacterium]
LYSNAQGNGELIPRQGNYAFEGEQMVWDVVVWDENGIESVTHVDGVVGDVEDMTADDDVEVECIVNGRTDSPYDYTDARDQSGQPLLFDAATMRWYTCTLTVETPESDDFYGEKFLSIRVEDQDGLMSLMTESEFVFLNPVVAIDVTGGPIVFDDGDGDGSVTPGNIAYSGAIIVHSAVDDDSSVELEMAISGTDFYDPISSHARCPDSNVLELTNFRYFATQADYDTNANAGTDIEGYDSIPYETGDISDRQPIIDLNNVLDEGAEMTVHFKLSMPQPCVGHFTDGDIYFWGRAI